jgi:SAM-dependent methyltransferase
VRAFLFQGLELASSGMVLEVGSGPGVITADLHKYTSAQVYGVDIDLPAVKLAARDDSLSHFSSADALALPFSSSTFDLVCCHFLLLWLSNPLQALLEMKRVVKPGKPVMAFAEPDYGGRIDYPNELVSIGQLQAEALHRQGADPHIGRQLPALFSQAGFSLVKAGVLGAQWSFPQPVDDHNREWSVLKADLSGFIPSTELDRLEKLENASLAHGERILYVPTFYAWGISK